MKKGCICLDIGGTEIKAAPIDEQGGLGDRIRYFAARAEEESEVWLEYVADIVRICGLSDTDSKNVRMAFPGPFDYEKGICLMQGLGKYNKLYGVNLRKELAARLEAEEKDILFMNDAAAFALGEMRFGEAADAARSLYICIGTGCGSAFGVEGKIAPPGTAGVPEDGYLYHVPFLDGRIDDYLSKRGLMELTREWLGTALDGKALAQRVIQRDERATQCFWAFGRRVRDALLPFLDTFQPEVLCFGGQITGSSSFFLPPVEESCGKRKIRLLVTEDTSLRTLQGLASMADEEAFESNTIE